MPKGCEGDRRAVRVSGLLGHFVSNRPIWLTEAAPVIAPIGPTSGSKKYIHRRCPPMIIVPLCAIWIRASRTYGRQRLQWPFRAELHPGVGLIALRAGRARGGSSATGVTPASSSSRGEKGAVKWTRRSRQITAAKGYPPMATGTLGR